MSGRKQGYVVGRFILKEKADRGIVHAFLLGDLYDGMIDLPYSLGHALDTFPGSIDAFADLSKSRPPSDGELRKIMQLISEEQIKAAFAELIGEPFVPKDWGGERSDLFSTRITIDGAPVATAFLLKGPAIAGPMYISSLGKRGDQIARLFDEPAEFLILQHGNKVETAVRKMMRTYAINGASPKAFCIIDGADTFRILDAYGFLGKDHEFLAKRRVKKRRNAQALS